MAMAAIPAAVAAAEVAGPTMAAIMATEGAITAGAAASAAGTGLAGALGAMAPTAAMGLTSAVGPGMAGIMAADQGITGGLMGSALTPGSSIPLMAAFSGDTMAGLAPKIAASAGRMAGKPMVQGMALNQVLGGNQQQPMPAAPPQQMPVQPQRQQVRPQMAMPQVVPAGQRGLLAMRDDELRKALGGYYGR